MQIIPNRAQVPNAVIASGLTHDDFKDRVITQYFNVNLVQVLGLPEAEADYHAYVTLGPYKSNVVTLQVRKKK